VVQTQGVQFGVVVDRVSEVVDLDAGCCGLAGSFGYEVEHYEVSRLIGAQRLFPALRGVDAEAVVVGFLAQPLVLLIRPLTRRPVVVDAFISLYDTLCFDRRAVRPKSVAGRLARWLDRTAFSQADIVVTDTEEQRSTSRASSAWTRQSCA
jgi:hypothetical protein